MPELDIYYPCVTVEAYDSRGFGCFKYVGICMIPSVYVFMEQLMTEEDYEECMYGTRAATKSPWTKRQSITVRKFFPVQRVQGGRNGKI